MIYHTARDRLPYDARSPLSRQAVPDSATSERERERGKERGEKEEVRKGKRGKGIPAREQIRETRSNLLIYLFSSSRFAREASRKWNERR